MRRRSFLAGAAASLATVGLAGCTDDDPGGPGDTPTELPRASRPRYQGEIVIATLQNPSPAAQAALTKAYQTQQPDVTIRWETQDWPDRGLYATWLSAQLAAAQTRPDIITGEYEPGFDRYVNLEEYRWRTNPYTGNLWDKDYLFNQSREYTQDGQRVRLGTESQHLSWFYNQGIFDEHSIQPPTNWDELVTACQTLQAAGVVPVSVRLAEGVVPWFAPIYFDQYHTDWADVVRAREGDWDWNPRGPEFIGDAKDPGMHARYTFSPLRFYQGLRDGALRFKTPAFVEMMANLARVFPQYVDPTALLGGDHYVPFLQGRTAMLVEASWALVRLDEDLLRLSPARAEELGVEAGSLQAFEWGVFEFPPMVSPLALSPIVRVPERAVGFELNVVQKTARQTAMTMDFLRFWLSRPGFQPFLQAEQSSEAWAPQGFALVADITYPDDFQKQLDLVAQKGVAPAAYSDFWVAGAGGKGAQDLVQLFGEAIHARLSPQEYADQAQAYVQGNFAALLKQAGLTATDLANPARRPGKL